MHVLLSYNVKVLINLQLVVVLIGRLMCGVTGVALASQIQELTHKKALEEDGFSLTVGRTKLSRLILLLHCIAIAGYNTLVIPT